MSGNCSLVCPVLTSLDHDGSQFTCIYTSWAYGLAAAFLFIGGLLPIVLLIYFFGRLKNSALKTKSNLRRQDSDASTFTDVSRPHDHSVYEVLRDDHDQEDVTFRTRKGAFPRHKYGTFSVPNLTSFEKTFDSSRKNLYPDLTQAFAPDSSQNGSGLPSPKEGYRVETEILPKDEVISELKFGEMYKDTCPNSDINSAGDQRCVTFSDKDRTLSRNSISKYSVEDTNTGVIDSGRVSTSPSSSGIIMGIDRSSPALTSSSPLPSYWSSVSETEIEGQLAQCRSFQPTPPVKHLVDGVDFDLYMKDCVGKLPEDQRNGTFLIRDSQSRIGCKVLVVFYKGCDPNNTLYHYQMRFTETNGVYLQGSVKIFPSIDDMINEFRKKKSLLPCLLSNCLGKNF